MKDIKKVIDLHKCMDEINRANKVMKGNNDFSELKKLKKQFEEAKKQFLQKRNELNTIQDNYNKVNEQVKKIKAEVDKNEDELYNNAGSDLKLIANLQSKIEKDKSELDEMENEAVSILEKEETIKLKEQNFRKQLIQIKEEFTEKKSNMANKVEKAKKTVNTNEKKMAKIKKNMDSEDVKLLEKISQHINPPVAKLTNGTCGGCRMNVSTITLNDVKMNKKIVYCDNCGRILYSDEE